MRRRAASRCTSTRASAGWCCRSGVRDGADCRWDFRVPGVTSISADLHKFGYAPKGASVLLQRGRDRQRAQYFATTRWPGYPVVNPTILGSKSAGPLAAAWAIIQALGRDGLRRARGSRAQRSTRALIERDRRRSRACGSSATRSARCSRSRPTSRSPPERRVDPHHWADAGARARAGCCSCSPG